MLLELKSSAMLELDCATSLELDSLMLLELSGLATSELDDATASLELDCASFASLLSGITIQDSVSQGTSIPYRDGDTWGTSSADDEVSSQLVQNIAASVRAIFFQCLYNIELLQLCVVANSAFQGSQ